MINDIKRDLRNYANRKLAEHSQVFFKTGEGEYGEGDKFLGITVPNSRKVANKYKSIGLNDVQLLLSSKHHEERLVALLILINKYEKGSQNVKQQIFDLYLKNTHHINNWDLVDVSAYKIVGKHLLKSNRKILYSLSASTSLWERRISIIATYEFIKQNDFKDTLKLAKRFINDTEDLIHKAVGWMLREIGKRDINTVDKFLNENYEKMPRVMLRYAIEKFSDKERQEYLKR